MHPIASVFVTLLGIYGVLEAANRELTFRKCPAREKCVYVTRCSSVNFFSGNTKRILSTISQHACGMRSDYLKVCCPYNLARYKKSADTDEAYHCGLNYVGNSHGTLSSGSRTLPRELPWVATVLSKDSLREDIKCSGSLISEWFVLTAAECISREESSLSSQSGITVLLGDFNIGEGKEYGVQYVSLHPSENAALLHLDEAVKFTPFVSPICLQGPITYNMESSPDYNQVIETGWEDSSSVLLKGKLVYLKSLRTNRHYGLSVEIVDRNNNGFTHDITRVESRELYIHNMHRENLHSLITDCLVGECCWMDNWCDMFHIIGLSVSRSVPEGDLMKTLSKVVPCPQPSEGTLCVMATGSRCYRTVGGPLMKIFNDSFTVVGVATSSAVDNLCAREPSEYTSVSHIMPWIVDNILL